MSNNRERFGRYLLLDHLVDGGMAKICRARYLGEQADKIVALKMVQPKYSTDEAYKKMFMDEIKVTFGLIHPNIVQTYDYGLYCGQLYVAMEYCDGRNLKEYLEKLKKRKFVFPVEISVYIISQVCQGLHYSHTFIDKLNGKAHNIIHRDISPHNIMLTFDGSIKIIDFGIAKSKVNVENTQAGTIKGKLSYLAPEYLEGKELDARYDLFACGITLWEMLCSRKLFKAKNDLAILKKIQECKVPAPSAINPNVPRELDDIVLKALSQNRERRFKNMDQFNRALMKFLYSHYPEFNATDLTYFAKELFKEEIAKDREQMFEFGKIDIRPYLKDFYSESNGGEQLAADEDFKPPVKSERSLDLGFNEDGEIEHTSEDDMDKTNPAKMLEKSMSKIDIESIEQSRTKTRTRKKSGTRHTKMLSRPKDNSKRNNFLVAGLVILALLGIQNKEKIKKIVGIEKKNPDDQIRIIPKNKPQRKFGLLILKNVDTTTQRVYINGEEQEVDILGEVDLPIGDDYVLRVESKSRRHFIKKFSLTDDKATMEINVPLMPQTEYGFLVTKRECISGKLFYEVFGEKRVARLPIPQSTKIAFPLKTHDDGRNPSAVSYSVEYQIDGEDFVRKTDFTIKQEADEIDFCDHLNFN